MQKDSKSRFSKYRFECLIHVRVCAKCVCSQNLPKPSSLKVDISFKFSDGQREAWKVNGLVQGKTVKVVPGFVPRSSGSMFTVLSITSCLDLWSLVESKGKGEAGRISSVFSAAGDQGLFGWPALVS